MWKEAALPVIVQRQIRRDDNGEVSQIVATVYTTAICSMTVYTTAMDAADVGAAGVYSRAVYTTAVYTTAVYTEESGSNKDAF